MEDAIPRSFGAAAPLMVRGEVAAVVYLESPIRIANLTKAIYNYYRYCRKWRPVRGRTPPSLGWLQEENERLQD